MLAEVSTSRCSMKGGELAGSRAKKKGVLPAVANRTPRGWSDRAVGAGNRSPAPTARKRQKLRRKPKRNCRSSALALVIDMKSPEEASDPSGLKVMFEAFAPGLLK